MVNIIADSRCDDFIDKHTLIWRYYLYIFSCPHLKCLAVILLHFLKGKYLLQHKGILSIVFPAPVCRLRSWHLITFWTFISQMILILAYAIFGNMNGFRCKLMRPQSFMKDRDREKQCHYRMKHGLVWKMEVSANFSLLSQFPTI